MWCTAICPGAGCRFLRGVAREGSGFFDPKQFSAGGDQRNPTPRPISVVRDNPIFSFDVSAPARARSHLLPARDARPWRCGCYGGFGVRVSRNHRPGFAQAAPQRERADAPPRRWLTRTTSLCLRSRPRPCSFARANQNIPTPKANPPGYKHAPEPSPLPPSSPSRFPPGSPRLPPGSPIALL